MESNDVKTIKGEWLSVSILVMINITGTIWWAATTESRLSYLEGEAEQGDRFTMAHGEKLESEIMHNRDIFNRHALRTEPKIDAIHSAIMDKYRHE